MWRALAIRFVLALYPCQVRDRYGDEIAGLLHRSPTPARDLANVALCAAAEHGGTMNMSQIKASARAAGLAALPLAVVVLWAAGNSAGIVAGALVHGGGEGIWLYVMGFAVPTVLVLPLAVRLAWRSGRRSRIARPAVVIPIAFALGILMLVSIPGPGIMVGERWDGTFVAVLVWLAGMVLIGSLPRWHWLAKAALAFVVLDVTIAAYLLNTFPPNMRPLSEAVLWYPLTVVGHRTA